MLNLSEFEELCDSLNIKNARSNPIGRRAFLQILDNSGYMVTKSKKKINDSRKMYYMIEIKRKTKRIKRC